MEAKELRIGNTVYANVLGAIQPLPLSWQIDSIGHGVIGLMKNISNDKYATITVQLDYLVPIQLTDEWLLNLGFEIKNKQYSLNVGNELFRYAIKDQFVIWDSNGSGYLKIKQQGNGWLLRECYSRNDLVYKYVHQLQNLYFSLTGTELELHT